MATSTTLDYAINVSDKNDPIGHKVLSVKIEELIASFIPYHIVIQRRQSPPPSQI